MPFEESLEDEIQRFEEQFRRQPESLVFARLADAHRKAGNPQRALEVLEEGIRRHEDYLSAHIVRARTYLDLERVEDARAAYQRVLEIDAQNLVALRGLARIARDADQPRVELRWLERLAQADPQNLEPQGRLEELRGRVGSDSSAPPAEDEQAGLPPIGDAWWTEPATTVTPMAGEPEPAGSDVADALWSGPAELPESGSEPTGAQPEGLEKALETLVDSLAGEVEEPEGAERQELDTRPAVDAWWFEPPAGSRPGPPDGDESDEEDADLLTRTMADLYARQGLVDEAEAIYRELLQDRPDDEGLHAGLDAVLGMRAARGATTATPREQDEDAGTPEPGVEAGPEPDSRDAAPEPRAAPHDAAQARSGDEIPPESPFLEEWLRGLRS